MASFIKNTLKLVSGSIIAQMVAIILIPVITRLYVPDDFGIYQLFLSITGMIAIVSALSYQLSIMLPEDDSDAAHLTILSLILTFFISIVSGFVLIIFSCEISDILNTPGLGNYLLIAPFVIFLNGTYHVLNYWLSRTQRYGGLAGARIGNSVTKRGIQVIFGLFKNSPFGLISGTLSGFFVADLIMVLSLWKKRNKFKNFQWKKARGLAWRYKKFPTYTTLATLSNQLSLQISPFMFAFYFSPVVVGYYSIANQVVNMPSSLIGTSISQVFFQKASEEKNKTGRVKTVVHEVHKRLVSIGIFPTMLLMIIGEELFSFFLGSGWYEAGIYAKILAPWFFMVFIAYPLSTVFSILELQGAGLYFNILLLISRIIALYIGGISGSPVFALILFSASGVFFWGWMNHYILRISEVNIRDTIRSSLNYFKYAIITVIPLIILKYIGVSSLILILAALGGALIYYSVILRNDPELKEKLAEIIRGNKRHMK